MFHMEHCNYKGLALFRVVLRDQEALVIEPFHGSAPLKALHRGEEANINAVIDDHRSFQAAPIVGQPAGRNNAQIMPA
jgi:hypothetical protein